MKAEFNRRSFSVEQGQSLPCPLLIIWIGRINSSKLVLGIRRFQMPQLSVWLQLAPILGFTPSWFPRDRYRIQNVEGLGTLGGYAFSVFAFSGLDHRAPNGHRNWSNF